MGIESGALVDANGNAITSQPNGSQEALDVGINVAGVQVDPRSIRPLTNADTVTADQGGTWNINNISGTVTLPTNAAQEAGGHLASVDSKLNSLGQKVMAGSVPVVVASDQSAIPVISTTAHGSLTDRSGTSSATPHTSTTAIPANASRKYLIIQNVSSGAILWINFTNAATETQPSLQLAIGATFTMEGNFVSTEAITIISNKASTAYTAKEA